MANAPLAIYIHWPYCARICPYCDFNVYKQRADESLAGAIIKDLARWREWSGAREIISVHFGGGTPSLMSGAEIESILAQINQLWGLPQTAEIGLEANPNNAAIDKLDDFKAAGINRLSLGVQSFHDPALKQLGRDHDGVAASAAVEAAIARFSTVSLDLIFGWQGQSEALLQQDLDIALSLGAPHISAYQLTIEAGTAFAKAEARGERRAVNNDASATFYDIVETRLSGAGFEHYEVSNFAKPNHRSNHNLAYWQGHDYVGVGPGAHGRMTIENQRYATIAALRPDAYKDKIETTGMGISERESLTPEGWRDEYVLMGLRINAGLSRKRLNEIYPDPDFNIRMTELIKGGYLETQDERLFTTPKGRIILNHITDKLLAG